MSEEIIWRNKEPTNEDRDQHPRLGKFIQISNDVSRTDTALQSAKSFRRILNPTAGGSILAVGSAARDPQTTHYPPRGTASVFREP